MSAVVKKLILVIVIGICLIAFQNCGSLTSGNYQPVAASTASSSASNDGGDSGVLTEPIPPGDGGINSQFPFVISLDTDASIPEQNIWVYNGYVYLDAVHAHGGCLDSGEVQFYSATTGLKETKAITVTNSVRGNFSFQADTPDLTNLNVTGTFRLTALMTQ